MGKVREKEMDLRSSGYSTAPQDTKDLNQVKEQLCDLACSDRDHLLLKP